MDFTIVWISPGEDPSRHCSQCWWISDKPERFLGKCVLSQGQTVGYKKGNKTVFDDAVREVKQG